MPPNPFTPTFGVTPPLLVGRDEEIATFRDALDDGPGSPGRAMLFTGVRGSGKTVMLNAIEDVAIQRGWLVLSETARPGVADELANTAIPNLLAGHEPGSVGSRIAGGHLVAAGFGAGISTEPVDRHPVVASLRSRLEALLVALQPHRTGVLISLDEVHRAAMDDMRAIAQVVQHAFREGRELAFAAAGLPSAVEDVLNDHVMTFLRRAERFSLGEVPSEDVRHALAQPVADFGRDIDPEALQIATEGTQGYPFLVQLVGYQMWNVDRASDLITGEHARIGVQRAVRRVGRLVAEPALASLSAIDRSFLVAMSVDSEPSRTAAIAERLGVDKNYVSQYRRRLIAAELIAPAGHGRVRFALPYLRDYLREHVASVALDVGVNARDRAVERDDAAEGGSERSLPGADGDAPGASR